MWWCLMWVKQCMLGGCQLCSNLRCCGGLTCVTPWITRVHMWRRWGCGQGHDLIVMSCHQKVGVGDIARWERKLMDVDDLEGVSSSSSLLLSRCAVRRWERVTVMAIVWHHHQVGKRERLTLTVMTWCYHEEGAATLWQMLVLSLLPLLTMYSQEQLKWRMKWNIAYHDIVNLEFKRFGLDAFSTDYQDVHHW